MDAQDKFDELKLVIDLNKVIFMREMHLISAFMDVLGMTDDERVVKRIKKGLKDAGLDSLLI